MTKANGLGPGEIEIDGEKYKTHTFEYDGERYTVREQSADESDDIIEMFTGPDQTDEKTGRVTPGKVNQRAINRMTLAKGIVSPEVTMDRVGKWPGPKYLAVVREFNKINSLPLANPTPPAGSAGPTSPGGGEPSPQS